MSLSGKLRALRRKIDERGAVGAVSLALRTLYEAVFRRDEILFVLPLAAEASAGTEGPAGAGVREIASADDLGDGDRAALGDYGGEAYLTGLEQRLREGWRLFLVDVDGAVAGGGWALTPATSLVSKVVPLVEGDVTIIDCFTFPERRGHGAYPALLRGIVRHYAAQGLLRAFIFTRVTNRASVRGIEKAGFTPVAVYWTFRLGSGELVWWRRRAAQAGGEAA